MQSDLNEAFWYGAILATLNECIKCRRELFDEFREHRVAWSIGISLPAFWSFVFISGSLIDWGFSKHQHITAPTFAWSFLAWIVTVVGEYILVTNSSMMRHVWEETRDNGAYPRRASLLYILLTTFSISPYWFFTSVYFDGNAIIPYVFIAAYYIITLALSYLFFSRFLSAERDEVRKKICHLYLGICRFSPNSKDATRHRISRLLIFPKEDLEQLLPVTTSAYVTIDHFDAFSEEESEADKALAIMLDARLPYQEVVKLAEVAKADAMSMLSEKRDAIKILIGSDAEAAAAEDAIRNLITKKRSIATEELLSDLLARRAVLKKGTL